MLIRYKKNHEKIAMGLLSFMPEEKKDVKKLQQTIKEYESNDDWHLHLWKEEDDVLGAIGIRIENGIDAIVQHVSVNPSHRNAGIGQKMVNEVIRIYQNKYAVSTTDEIQDFYNKCTLAEDSADASDS
ncbi:GNAT family N-acetyltransferase [Oceanobacillus profundus]|uniref:N-acetyltransferase n=1 Tax=Oceanobacillus profundus TaxID=372463 RepID=A0A417YFL6_9BACI|nr:GNAT family N-acetyltransferase [Oceanobacillus profundus]MBR3120734.1 GNAT family N-acetyltransferase [Oceanobacillus sp.]PAE29868.1 N-acetyltransferase [Paenibacillus sp. 7884-2]MCM3396580.1 GNAT family N-acetyltransferase [Oceanobacillus profundus]MDO6451077.1 GNAT family N-acetyltransferase [Oceanobacillus profundus]RHW31538.1 N-acetyltransferase [Oceanobacillus profundus]